MPTWPVVADLGIPIAILQRHYMAEHADFVTKHMKNVKHDYDYLNTLF